jgi:hypothetical protein
MPTKPTKRGRTEWSLTHARVAAELVLLADDDVWIHGGVAGWDPTRHGPRPVTVDERWVAARGTCRVEHTSPAAPPEGAVAWDPKRRRLQPATRWPGKPAFGSLTVADGVSVRAGGRRSVDAGKFGTRPEALATVTLKGPDWTRQLKLSAARADPTLTPLRDGRVVVSGGYTIDMDFSWEDVYTGSAAVDVVDPTARTVKRAAGLQVARYHHAVIELASGLLLVVGGASRDDSPLASVELIAV